MNSSFSNRWSFSYLKFTKYVTNYVFNLPVEVSEHKTLNSSKRIIRDKTLKGKSDDNIRENLQEQGVTAAKRFKVKTGHDFVDTNTILLTFNSVVPPK